MPPKKRNIESGTKNENVPEKKPKIQPVIAFVLQDEFNCGHDIIIRYLDRDYILKILSNSCLGWSDYSALASTSRAWYVLFNHPYFDLWKMLGKANKKTKFSFVKAPNLYTLSGFKPLRYYLNINGLAHCPKCDMFTDLLGTNGIPISSFVMRQDGLSYMCVNPLCKAPITFQICGIDPVIVFEKCIASAPRETKQHTFQELDVDLTLPNGRTLMYNLSTCTRCGVLGRFDDHDGDADYSQEDYVDECPECFEYECVCPPCSCCGYTPLKCKCTLCLECLNCTDCEISAIEGSKCTCDFCDECGMERPSCECMSSDGDYFY